MALQLCVLTGCGSKKEVENKIPFYIGTYTTQSSDGIYLSSLDTVTSELSLPQLVFKLSNPSFLTLSQDGKLLFAISENNGESADLFVFHREPNSNQLTLVDSIQTGGRGACYVSEVVGKYLVVAHYSSGDVVFVPYSSDGSLQKEGLKQFAHQGSGLDKKRQASSHVHSAVPDPKGEFVYVADLGTDEVRVYQLADDSIRPIKTLTLEPGSGPRHISFHNSGQMMALINELSSDILLYGMDSQGVFSDLIRTVKLFPDSMKNEKWAADIHFSQDGNNLYASVRGVDRIYFLEVTDGDVEIIGFLEDQINWPRSFAQDPTGNFLLVANQKGNDVILYKRDPKSGRLTLLKSKIKISQPVCLKF